MFLQQFAINLASGMFLPLCVLSIVSVIVLAYGFFVRSKYESGVDARAQNAEWWQHAMVQLSVVGWTFYIILQAVPPPNYIIKEVKVGVPGPERVVYKPQTKIVTRTINKAMIYAEAFKRCKVSHGYNQDGEKPGPLTTNRCHVAAIALTRPEINQITTVKFKIDPYRKLYSECMQQYSIDSKEEGKERDVACHNNAMQVRSSLGLKRLTIDTPTPNINPQE